MWRVFQHCQNILQRDGINLLRSLCLNDHFSIVLFQQSLFLTCHHIVYVRNRIKSQITTARQEMYALVPVCSETNCSEYCNDLQLQ